MTKILAVLRWVGQSKPVQWVLIALAVISGIAIRDRGLKAEARDEERERQSDADKDRALDVHRRANAARGMPVDPDDQRIFRN